jgi:hypothetical protein
MFLTEVNWVLEQLNFSKPIELFDTNTTISECDIKFHTVDIPRLNMQEDETKDNFNITTYKRTHFNLPLSRAVYLHLTVTGSIDYLSLYFVRTMNNLYIACI